jgi:hypothetical protein
MAKVYLIPKKDVLVPLPRPSTGYLPADGDFVEMEIYWQRIINDGDATIGKQPKSKTDPAAPV